METRADETQRMLRLLNDSFPDIASLSPLEARAAADARIRPAVHTSEVATVDSVISGPRGGIPVRSYRAEDVESERPTVVFAHGGGFLHGSIDGHDAFCRTMARQTRSPVVSVGYRLAPEHGAPAGAEDVVAVAEHVGRSQASPVVLAGDSSGGNVAAVAALTLRDTRTVSIAAQVLIYPFLDPGMRTPSHRRLSHGHFVTARSLRAYWDTYLDAPGSAVAEPWQINPARAEDHTGLPPAVVITGGMDPLCDEGREYAAVLRGAGVPTIHREYPDQFHGFLTLSDYGPAAQAQSVLWDDLETVTAASG